MNLIVANRLHFMLLGLSHAGYRGAYKLDVVVRYAATGLQAIERLPS